MALQLAFARVQWAATIIFHCLFRQLTMGLALVIAVFATRGHWWTHERAKHAAHVWTRIFAECAGGVIGQTLAMEGGFAFFLESAFLGVMLAGEERVGARLHWVATLLVFLGSWLSGYFILGTNAWMQHPVGHALATDHTVRLTSFFSLLGNSWLLWQYTHSQCAAAATGSFVVAAVGAYDLLAGKHPEQRRQFLRTALVIAAASVLLLYPTGDGESRQVLELQPIKGAAMEDLFYTTQPAPMTIVGQPNLDSLSIDNPIEIPGILSFLTYRRFGVAVLGLASSPRDQWPDYVALGYYAYHIMVGLGTICIAITLLGVFLLWRRNGPPRTRLVLTRAGPARIEGRAWPLVQFTPSPDEMSPISARKPCVHKASRLRPRGGMFREYHRDIWVRGLRVRTSW
jgi:cytochrome d ubiquinol oxidase subunit I